MCTSGLWPVIPQAPWIWSSQFTTNGQDTVTFTKTFTVSAATSATLTVDADNSFIAKLNGTQVLTGLLGPPSVVAVQLLAGTNVISITVTNLPGFSPSSNPAGLAWKLT
jgi:hypothetical protein